MVGRQTDCNLRVPAIDVSRRHCEIMLEDDELTVRDLGSRNGTYVNGQKTDIKELSPGDVLSVGPLVFVVQIDGEPDDFDPREKHRIGSETGEESKSRSAKSEHADEPTRVGTMKTDAPAATAPEPSSPGGLLDDVGLSNADDDSSVIDFDFDFDDDDDDQPPL